MNVLAKVTTATKPRTPQSGQVSLFFAGLLAVMAVAQLFTFESFIVLLGTFELPLGLPPMLVASFIVIAEVFALPFLLRMDLSVAFRWLSMGLSWLVVAFWLFVSVWLRSMVLVPETVGFLGSIPVTPGLWVVLFSISLGILAVWSSWGLWPGRRTK